MSTYSVNIANRHPADRCPGFVTDLILRCAAGEEAALGSLFDHLYPLVIAIVGGEAPCASEDAVVLAAFRRLWVQAPTYDPKVLEPVAWVVSQATAALAEFGVTAVPGDAVILTC